MIYALEDLWRGLRQQRARAALTVLGIVWGTLAIVLLLAFGFGLEAHMLEQNKGLGDGIAIVWGSRTTKSYDGFPKGRAVELSVDDVLCLPGEIPGLEAVSPEYQNFEIVAAGSRLLRVGISGVHPDFGRLRNLRPSPGGRFIDGLDIRLRRRVAFLGNSLAESLFGAAPAVGRSIFLRGTPFTVIGVLQPKEQGSDYGTHDTHRVFLPTTTHAAVFGNTRISNFVFRAADPRRQSQATDRVYAVLARRHHFDPADRQALSIWDTTEELRMVYFIFVGFNLLLGLSGGLTLLVGGVGTANMMYILVRQRTREIGIQLAVGARPRQILTWVMAQAITLVAVGGAAGFGLAWLVILAARSSPLTEEVGTPTITPLLAVLAASLLAVVGLLAGYFPARRAARLDPVAAMTS